jgi:cytochrome P450
MSATSEPNSAEPRLSWPLKRRCPLDPPPELSEVRTAGGAARVKLYDGNSALMLTRHDAIRQVLHDRTVSSDGTNAGFPTPSAVLAVQRSSPNRSFPRMDPPEHTRLRRFLQSHFSLGKARERQPAIEAIVDELLDDMLSHGSPVDLVATFAHPLPARVTCNLLGLPAKDSDFLDDRVSRRAKTDLPTAEMQEIVDELVDYFSEVVARRLQSSESGRARPGGDDLISQLLPHVETGALEEEELVRMMMIVLAGGYETTANMISLGVVALLSHPDQLAELIADPSLWPNAIEELLRYLSVAHQEGLRLATRDMNVAGCPVHAGEGLVVPVMAANRDPEVFPNPDELDIHRDSRAHLAFGGGIHACIGMSLARVELLCAFSRLFTRLPELRIDADPDALNFVESALIYGVSELPVAW